MSGIELAYRVANHTDEDVMMGISRYTRAAGIQFLSPGQTKKQTPVTDGKITQNEFVNARPAGVTRERAQALFAELDEKKTGTLARAEIVAALGKDMPSKVVAEKLSDTTLTTLFLSIKGKGKQTASA